jgi:hypothetical protein
VKTLLFPLPLDACRAVFSSSGFQQSPSGLLSFHRRAPTSEFDALAQEYLIELEDIFKAKLDIHSAENDNDLIKVSCNQRDSNFDYCGGFLYIACDDIEIFDQSGSEITTSRLDEIFKEYSNCERTV